MGGCFTSAAKHCGPEAPEATAHMPWWCGRQAPAHHALLHDHGCMIRASCDAPMQAHASWPLTSTVSPDTATMRLMNTSSSKMEALLTPLTGWKMITSPGEGGLQAVSLRSFAEETQKLCMGCMQGQAALSITPNPTPITQQSLCYPRNTQQPASPCEAVGELLCNQPVPNVKARVHGQGGDEPGLRDEPARVRAVTMVNTGQYGTPATSGQCWNALREVLNAPGCSCKLGRASLRSAEMELRSAEACVQMPLAVLAEIC